MNNTIILDNLFQSFIIYYIILKKIKQQSIKSI